MSPKSNDDQNMLDLDSLAFTPPMLSFSTEHQIPLRDYTTEEALAIIPQMTSALSNRPERNPMQMAAILAPFLADREHDEKYLDDIPSAQLMPILQWLLAPDSVTFQIAPVPVLSSVRVKGKEYKVRPATLHASREAHAAMVKVLEDAYRKGSDNSAMFDRVLADGFEVPFSRADRELMGLVASTTIPIQTMLSLSHGALRKLQEQVEADLVAWMREHGIPLLDRAMREP